MTEPREQTHQDDPIAEAWKALGIFLGLGAFLALSLPPLVRGEDPVPAGGVAAVAFLGLWGLNRILAFLFGFDRPPVTEPPAPGEQSAEGDE